MPHPLVLQRHRHVAGITVAMAAVSAFSEERQAWDVPLSPLRSLPRTSHVLRRLEVVEVHRRGPQDKPANDVTNREARKSRYSKTGKQPTQHKKSEEAEGVRFAELSPWQRNSKPAMLCSADHRAYTHVGGASCSEHGRGKYTLPRSVKNVSKSTSSPTSLALVQVASTRGTTAARRANQNASRGHRTAS